MKIINYFGEEIERTEEPKLSNLKDMIEIYMVMRATTDIDNILKTLTKEESKMVMRSAYRDYRMATIRSL